MLGILYYIYFLILGFVYSKYIFNKNIYFHIWIGGLIGNLLMMIGIVIPSLIFGFTILSHIVLSIISIIPFLIIIMKKGINSVNNKIITFDKKG